MQQSHRTRKQTVCLGSTLVPEPPRRQVSAPNRSGRGKHTFVSGSFHAKTQAYILLGPPDVRDRIVYVEPDLSENEQTRLGRGGGELAGSRESFWMYTSKNIGFPAVRFPGGKNS